MPFKAKANANATQRDKHLTTIAEHGGISWQRSSGYNRRSLVETTMFRYKTVIGRRLHARTLPNQRTEAKVGCNVLNRVTSRHAGLRSGPAPTVDLGSLDEGGELLTHWRGLRMLPGGTPGGNWLVVHEHISVPVDLATDKPDLESKP